MVGPLPMVVEACPSMDIFEPPPHTGNRLTF
jgi:hypothetical protein